MLVRRCKQCLQTKPINEFLKYPNRGVTDRIPRTTGHHTICKVCYSMNSNVNRVYKKKLANDPLTETQEKLLVDMAKIYKLSVAHGGDPHGAYAAAVLGREKKTGVVSDQRRGGNVETVLAALEGAGTGVDAIGDIAACDPAADRKALQEAKEVLVATGAKLTWQQAKELYEACGEVWQRHVSMPTSELHDLAVDVGGLFDRYVFDQEEAGVVDAAGLDINQHIYGRDYYDR